MRKYSFLFFLLLFVHTAFAGKEELSFRNPNLSPGQRAEMLLQKLSLEQKISLMTDVSQPVEDFEIKPYNWWNEALHGCARAGLATVFPQAIGMAASFDPLAVEKVFDAVSDETRAKHHLAKRNNEFNRYQGLTMWTPNVNIFRDPRWGRGQETYGEDPFLATQMGLAVVRGLQGPPDSRYDKLHACAKHFVVHSGPEKNRHAFDVSGISQKDLLETYFPAFEALVREGNVKEVMCAYNSFNGTPCCGSDQLLIQILRKEWGFDGIVVSDCGAIANFYNERGHKVNKDAVEASANGVRNGTDIECGSTYKALTDAVNKGLLSEEEIDISVMRILKARFELGEMDHDSLVSWASMPTSVIASAYHDSLALDIARKSIVLLSNKNNLLPLSANKGATIAVMGPNAHDSVMLWGNYNGTPPYTTTILQGIKQKLGPTDRLIYEKVSECISREVFESRFNTCSSEQGNGFSARYWNNPDCSGKPEVITNYSSPFQLCTSGATVFAPGISLSGFSAVYQTTFSATRDELVVLDLYVNGKGFIEVDGVVRKEFRCNHGARRTTLNLDVKTGKTYDIRIVFNQHTGDAQFNLDFGIKVPTDMNRSVSLVKDADIVIFVGGISPQLEGEEMKVDYPGFNNGDRTDIELPAVQREFLQKLKQAGKKVIFVNCSGSAIGLEPEQENCDAILQAWYPGQAGGRAVADIIFGDYNPTGKLPVTFYKNVTQLPGFDDYSMAGRTYRYLAEEPLFPFGFGLGYSEFSFGNALVSSSASTLKDSVRITIPIKNTGKRVGEELVQLYIRKLDSPDTAGSLRAFKRVSVSPGQSEQVVFNLSEKEFRFFDERSYSLVTVPGIYRIYYGNSSDPDNQKFTDVTIL
ncbi:MAG: xylan 1,4-beta-xylosidase [Bacteroidales bacterium]